jgi:hypothetical protein
MSKGPSDFKMTNVKRAIVGVEMAGITIGSIEVKPDGTVSIIPQGKEKPAAGNEWDQDLVKASVPVRS